MKFIVTICITVLYVCFQNSCIGVEPKVLTGVDRVFTEPFKSKLKGKKIGLVTNQTGINGSCVSTIDLFKNKQKEFGYTLEALFAPEHGLTGEAYANVKVEDGKTVDDIPIYSLFGSTRGIHPEMFSNVDYIVFDIQDVGSRPYTYVSMLCAVLENAAKALVPVMVLDRPNPRNGIVVDGPMVEKAMLDKKPRSLVCYLNIPYCHGMTIGELGLLYNEEYNVNCDLTVVPMSGWKRNMTYKDTGLVWIPPSPYMPEAETALVYPTTGILGEISIASIGIGYTLPFKVVGAPWMDGELFASSLNKEKLPGVQFIPTKFKPFAGNSAHQVCSGILIAVRDPSLFLPVTTHYLILTTLQSLYPDKFQKVLEELPKAKREMFCRVCGTDEIFDLLLSKKATFEKLKKVHQKERVEFLKKRQKYILKEYN